MINKLLTLLRSPYPSLVKRWKSVIIPSLIVFLILFVLQPFGISMMGGYKFWVVLGYGVVSSLALSISTYLFPALFPRYHSEKNWTLGRELLGTLGACLLIAIGNCFYTAWVFGSFILSWKGFLISLAWVAVLAPFPIIFFLMWNRNLQLVRNLKEATEINYALAKRENTQKEKIRTRNEEQIGESSAVEEVAEEEEETPMQLVFSGGTKEMLEVDAHTLFYVEAEGNYIRVAYSSADKMQQKVSAGYYEAGRRSGCRLFVHCPLSPGLSGEHTHCGKSRWKLTRIPFETGRMYGRSSGFQRLCKRDKNADRRGDGRVVIRHRTKKKYSYSSQEECCLSHIRAVCPGYFLPEILSLCLLTEIVKNID